MCSCNYQACRTVTAYRQYIFKQPRKKIVKIEPVPDTSSSICDHTISIPNRNWGQRPIFCFIPTSNPIRKLTLIPNLCTRVQNTCQFWKLDNCDAGAADTLTAYNLLAEVNKACCLFLPCMIWSSCLETGCCSGIVSVFHCSNKASGSVC